MAAALFKSLTNFTRAKIFIGLQSRNKNNFEKVAWPQVFQVLQPPKVFGNKLY